MYDQVIAWVRTSTGAKTEGSRAKLVAEYKEHSFEYETGQISVTVEKDGRPKQQHGYYLRVKDPVEVLKQSARVHCEALRVAYRGNVPAGVWPVVVSDDRRGRRHDEGCDEAPVCVARG